MTRSECFIFLGGVISASWRFVVSSKWLTIQQRCGIHVIWSTAFIWLDARVQNTAEATVDDSITINTTIIIVMRGWRQVIRVVVGINVWSRGVCDDVFSCIYILWSVRNLWQPVVNRLRHIDAECVAALTKELENQYVNKGPAWVHRARELPILYCCSLYWSQCQLYRQLFIVAWILPYLWSCTDRCYFPDSRGANCRVGGSLNIVTLSYISMQK